MSTISVRVSYRPVRIGWCVDEGDRVGLEQALRLTHCFWGGRFNPVIPVGDPKAAVRLVDVFRVDALFPVSSGKQVKDFINTQRHLPWPFSHDHLFLEGYETKHPALLDIRAALLWLREQAMRYGGKPRREAVRPTWLTEDPLNLVMLATFGAFEAPEQAGVDYCKEFSLLPGSRLVELTHTDQLPAEAFQWLTPSRVTTLDLYDLHALGWERPGLYVGSSGHFADIVNFWNLRAADIEVLFYDWDNVARLDPLVQAYCQALATRPKRRFATTLDDMVAVWSKAGPEVKVPSFVANPICCSVSDSTWNGANVRPGLMRFDDQWCLGMLDEAGERPSVTFQLPKPPVPDGPRDVYQHVVVSLSPLVDVPGDGEFTWNIPYLPELNEYFGREAHFVWNCARAEPDGLGVVENLSADHLTIRALKTSRLFAEVFQIAGVEAHPSAAGRIASRLVAQMGGLQGCRPFKIRGVRDLLGKYSALACFTRSAATQAIAMLDPVSKQPHFSAYEHTFIEPRSSAKLTPDQVFDYLCSKGVFRVGLEFRCTACGQRFWRHLDDVRVRTQCEYCGTELDVTPQLKDRDWRYRRSGLFGRDNNQEGAVPVVLLLQQLDTLIHSSRLAFSTALELKPTKWEGPKCETDFAILARGRDGRVQLAIGECKAAKRIESTDVENLARLAAAFPRKRIQVFIVFAKTVPFTSQELATVRDSYEENVILLSDRELEPYFAYERAAEQFEINRHAISLEDMAQNTHSIYFEPKPKRKNIANDTRRA